MIHFYSPIYKSKFVKFGGQLGIVVPGLMQDFKGEVPQYLNQFWDPGECFSFHTLEWWRQHWAQTQIVNLECADTLPDGWRHWLLFEETKVAAGTNRHDDEVPALRGDQGQYLGFVRMIARKR